MKLIIPILLNAAVAVLLYVIFNRTPMKKTPKAAMQIAIGVIFGLVSAFASDFGVELLGTTINVRDAAPLTAGLLFGGPAGIFAGLIGGAYRWLSVLWGGGEYTRLACSLATVLAGLMAAAVRRLMFDNKRPTLGYALCCAAVCEVVHMLLILLTNMNDSAYAFEYVKGCAYLMILGNMLSVALSVIAVSIAQGGFRNRKKGKTEIAETFQRWLLLCFIIAYLVTALFSHVLYSGMADTETKELFASAIEDVKKDVRGKSDDYMLDLVRQIAKEYEDSPGISLDALSEKYAVTEINIVDKNGLIIKSTDPDLEGVFNMGSTQQSKEFLVLNGSKDSLVQEYGPVGSDGATMRKFAGVSLEGGGFVQVGYSAEQFHKMLDGFVIDVTKNRHVGTEGFVAVCNEGLMLVTDTELNGSYISCIGIEPDEDMLGRRASKGLCRADVVRPGSESGEEYLYTFVFVEGYCIIAAMPMAAAMLIRDTAIYTGMLTQVLVFAVLFVFIYILIKRVIINNLKRVNKALEGITEGDLDIKVSVTSNAEFASLSEDINQTVDTLKRYIGEAEARIDKELEYAKQIQLSALPRTFPDDGNYRIDASMLAAKEVGGDFYDFYRLSDTQAAFLVADVSGKGIPAAMFMMTAKTVIKDLAESGMAVNEIFEKANDKLCENNESGMFVTCWMGVLNTKTGVLSYANAGHNPPVIERNGGGSELLRSAPGFVLAGMEGIKYRLNELTLAPGDRILLYTDGVTEAMDKNDALYGEERLLDCVNRCKNEYPGELLQKLKGDIDAFALGAPQADDITMLVLDYRPGKEMAMTFDAKTQALADVLGFVEERLADHGCPDGVMNAVCVAVEEVFVNVARYAYGDGEGKVTLTVGFDEITRNISIRISDGGKPFDPLQRPDPDITLSAEEREIGGLGIFIAKKTMDTIEYAYENGKNNLTMIKRI